MSERILTAHRLHDGVAIFLGPGNRWVEAVGGARVEREETGWAALDEAGRAGVDAALVVEPYLIDVVRDADGRPRPLRYRERLRAQGPSTHPHLGKQADAPAPAPTERAA
ncbi:MAG: DUF2849 domain-containing protein [Marivibrio sp.]|uniref:DUF2849 domain-containing protein n=1 Tax=Marivibrio sp. TaxID=2039719 RepID=UPI0032EC42DC